MGKKLCVGSSDTPLVTLDCTIINVTRSPNVHVDVTDSPVSEQQEEEDPPYRRCCCLLWRRRPRQLKNEKGEMKAKENQVVQVIPLT
jgi:hypothetical protein